MLCFQLPKYTSNHIDKLNRNFFWKKSDMKKGLTLIAWDKKCIPKSKGGLGPRRTEASNKTFRCNFACKILTNESSI